MSETIQRTEQENTGETFVEIENLKTYYDEGGLFGGNPVKAVDDVSFEIKRGETVGLVGESGCGKTTLGRTLVQLERATAGTVRFDGTDITSLSGKDLKEWRRNAQIVFQDPDSSLNQRMTIGEIIREPLDVHDWKTSSERRARVRELLDTVGLREEHYYRYPHQFSGGQRQRIGIARALALSPEFIVLDEPVSALDVSVQAKILNLLEDLQDKFDLTYLFIAHDLSVVSHICDRVAVMYLGNIMEIGRAEELFTDPANPYTHSLLSAIPEPDPESDKKHVTLRGTPPSPRYPPAGCPFSTRCPVKIRPTEEFEDLDNELWDRIEILRGILSERMRAERSLMERAKELLGGDTRFTDIGEVNEELFADVDIPDDVSQHISQAEEYVRNGREQTGREYLEDKFSSECDIEMPVHHEVSDTGRVSLCHRHKPEHHEPDEYFEGTSLQ